MKIKTYCLALLFLALIISCQKKSVQLDFTSNQDSSVVYINETKVGNTPVVTNVYSGIIHIMVHKDGYEDFNITDTLYNDTIVKIQARLYTKEELIKIEEQKRIAEQIKKQKEIEEQQFISKRAGEFNDYRDNHKYKWVKIGQQIWMAENLAFKLESQSAKCWAYDNNSSYVKSYGYLYNWKSAQEACPEGWHIPTEAEWQQLSAYLGGDNRASEKMREQGFNHWIDGYYYRPIATNESGFTARPGGQRSDKGEFITIGTYANWWSSTEKNGSEAFCLWLGYMGDFLNKEARKKNCGLSVRCIKD